MCNVWKACLLYVQALADCQALRPGQYSKTGMEYVAILPHMTTNPWSTHLPRSTNVCIVTESTILKPQVGERWLESVTGLG